MIFVSLFVRSAVKSVEGTKTVVSTDPYAIELKQLCRQNYELTYSEAGC